jgi:uncharacterized repeat protein (TIGR01451 family)
MNARTIAAIAGAALAALAFEAQAAGQASASYRIPADTVDAGVGDMSSASYRLSSSVGDLTADGLLSSASYRLSPGFRIQAITLEAIAPLGSVAVNQSASPNPAGAGKDVIFTLTATNNGSSTATGVTLTDPIPAGSSYVWTSSACALAAGTVTCSAGSIAVGASAVFILVVRPAAAGSITNNASVSAASDPPGAFDASSLNVIVNATPPGVATLRYRLYSPVTLEHHFTTDQNEYNVLGTYIGTWVQEGTVGKVLDNPGSFNGVTATPYYRLYDTLTRWHHWTTDPNEYYILSQFPAIWNAEGVDGYILPTNTAGATQLYRLLYPYVAGGLHHWTIDANEYSVLTSPSRGWIGEGGAGFVIQ